ncbi:uncharacterized protein [Elaeis guineensis]|uniref:Uncharacterized protein LOC105032506 n=1 Tax=Elaeis guineensis var. tenera TaxID=51953 RepID=A0A6I9Q8K4_ELAGV|nr:uncharacterized protein LOC105032506 [Elaeis guineensis]
MAQQQQEKWVTFDEEEEALSLSDFPVIADGAKDEEKKSKSSPDHVDDFEFRVSVGGGLLSKAAAETDMCAADEVFFQGQILPLRPSISSDSSLFSNSRCASRSESMDRYPSAISSLGFESSRSNSSSSSVSRSHSSNSHSSISCDPPRLSASNNFYTHPSPTPQVRIVRRNAGRRSISSSAPGWGILRLGVVKTPEIELYDLRSRRSSNGGMNSNPKKSNGDAGNRKKVSEGKDGSISNSACTHDAGNKSKGEDKVDQKKVQWFMGRGLGCKCSPDSVGIVSSKVVIAKNKKEEGEGLKRGESMCRSRIFEWLEELSVTKATGS